MDPILRGLNDEQQRAVTSNAAVLQVLAPPGSGKTKTLTARVAYLITHDGLRPWNMIVCTFTIKAAREMKERIRQFVGDQLESKLVLGTFHSVARRYLVTYGQYIGLEKGFGVADTSDSTAILKRLIKRHSFGTIEPAVARSRISRRKSKIQTNSKRPQTDIASLEFEDLFAKYEEALKSQNLLDYDDLLLRCRDLLRSHPQCVHNVQAVLIDEFQDTNTVQYELMSLFAQHQGLDTGGAGSSHLPSITIVGDPDQSIYSFRYAEIKNLKRMTSQYQDTQVVILEQNYRSSGSILKTSNEIIQQDDNRFAKEMTATHGFGQTPVFRKLPDPNIEGAWIVREVKRLIHLSAGLLTLCDFAILVRSAQLSRPIEVALGQNGIPYKMVGGGKFFERVEVKILLDYLRVVNQPDHTDALLRILNVPSRKIGDATSRALVEEAELKGWTLWKLIYKTATGTYQPSYKLTSQAEKGLSVFTNIILTSQAKLAALNPDQDTVADLLNHILQKLSYESFLRRQYPQDHEIRLENVEELKIQAVAAQTLPEEASSNESLFQVEGVEQQALSGPQESLARFLANVALSSEVEISDGAESQQLTISTIHAAKGLEWPVVFVPGVYEGSIPHSRADDHDEERRLLYVGMTRAKCLLYISVPKQTMSKDTTRPCPFLSKSNRIEFFAPHGALLDTTTLRDLALVLGRECPSESVIFTALSVAKVIQDDVWLAEDPEENERITGKASLGPGAFYKRSQTGSMSTEFIRGSEHGVSSHSGPVAMGGFVSASIRKRELDELDQIVAKQPSGPERRRNPVAKRLKHKQQDDGGIMKFVTRTTTETTNPISYMQPKTEPRTTSAPSTGVSRILQESINFNRKRQPVISSDLASRKPRSAPSSARLKTIENDSVDTARYILLSSSPPRPVGRDERECTVDTGIATAVSEDQVVAVKPPHLSIAPAQLEAASTGSKPVIHRRTLGVRRSMKPWSAAKPASGSALVRRPVVDDKGPGSL